MSRRKLHKPRRARPAYAAPSFPDERRVLDAGSPPTRTNDRPVGWAEVPPGPAAVVGLRRDDFSGLTRAPSPVMDESAVIRLRELVAARDLAGQAVDAEVLSLRRRGLTWTVLGTALGVSRQAARQRYAAAAATVARTAFESSLDVQDRPPILPTGDTADEMTDTGPSLQSSSTPTTPTTEDTHDD